jgi:hypothetical protein
MARLLVARKKPLTEEGFFKEEAEVERYVDKLTALWNQPEDQALRSELKIGSDILGAEIREAELRNWLHYLVIPQMQQAA